MAGALDDIKVLDFTAVYSGPFCTLLLKEMGAEVIKVERLTGDTVRNDAPLTKERESGTFIILNRGKKSITLNVQTEQGKEIIRELVKDVDVVVENYSPGTMDKLGLGNKELCSINPRLIFASISAYGQTGPRRDGIGYDPVAQAMGGVTSVSGTPEQPIKCSVAIGDFSAGLYTAYAILAALHHRERTGEGQVIDISIQDCIWSFASIEFSPHYFLNGKVPPRLGNGHSAMSPANMYMTKNGAVIIATGTIDQVQKLYRTIGREDLIDTPLCAQAAERYKHKDEIDAIIGEWAKTKTVEEIEKLFAEAGLACSAVPSFDKVCNDPHLYHREMIVDVEQPISGKVRTPGSVFKLSKTPGYNRYPAPGLGEHNAEVYKNELGFSENQINNLKAKKII